MKRQTIRLKVDPIPQTGHNCKTVALACLDNYYAKLLGYQPIALHKNKLALPLAKASMRQIAKKFGSVQGELLEIRQVQEIAEYIGYQPELVDYKGKLDLFRASIQKSLAAGNPLIVFFAVDRDNGLPSSTVDLQRSNEHAALICGYDSEKNQVEMVHWEKHRFCSLEKLFESANALPEHRNREYYQKDHAPKKYELMTPSTTSQEKALKASLLPTQAGFCAKLITMKKPDINRLFLYRNKMAQELIDQLIDYTVKKVIKSLAASHEELALKAAPHYRSTIHQAIKLFKLNNDYPALKKRIDLAGKNFSESAHKKTQTPAAKLKHYALIAIANLSSHLLGLITLGLGFYFNYQHKKRTGNWLLFNDRQPLANHCGTAAKLNHERPRSQQLP